MVRQGADVNAMNDDGETPLYAACFIGDIEAASILLNAFADPNLLTKEGSSCLHNAVQAHNIDLVSRLLECGANPSVSFQGESPVDIAYKFRFPDIINLLQNTRDPSYTFHQRGIGERSLSVAHGDPVVRPEFKKRTSKLKRLYDSVQK